MNQRTVAVVAIVLALAVMLALRQGLRRSVAPLDRTTAGPVESPPGPESRGAAGAQSTGPSSVTETGRVPPAFAPDDDGEITDEVPRPTAAVPPRRGARTGGLIEAEAPNDSQDAGANEGAERNVRAESLLAGLQKALERDETERTLAIGDRLADMGDQATPLLVAAAQGPSGPLQREAFRLLCRIGSAESIAGALSALLTAEDRDAAALTTQFASVRAPAVPSLLVKVLGQTEDPGMRQRIRNVLQAMEGDVVESLRAGLAEPIGAAYRGDLLSALAGVVNPANVAALERLLVPAEPADVRQAAATALAAIGTGEACQALVKRGTQGGADGLYCLRALAAVRSPYGQATLLALAAEHKRPLVRAAAADALGSQKSSDVRTKLVVMYENEADPEVREIIAEAVGRIDEAIGPPPTGEEEATEMTEKPVE